MGEAMGNMGPFESFLLLVGQGARRHRRLPEVEARMTGTTTPAPHQRKRYARLLAIGTKHGARHAW